MSEKTTLDFSNVASAEGGNSKYLSPGIYFVRPTAVDLLEPAGKSPAIQVTFEAVNEAYEGQFVKEKFFLTPKALPRIQYLHEAYFDYKLDSKAITIQELAKYFAQKMLGKPKTIAIVVGAQKATDGKLYASLPYTDFIAKDEASIEEGSFDEDSEDYRKVIRVNTNPSTRSNAPILSRENSASRGGAGRKLPWEKVGETQSPAGEGTDDLPF